MEQIPPTPFNRFAGFGLGFVVGIGAQILFRMLVIAIIGPTTVLFSSQTLALFIILLIPPIVTGMFVRVMPGSVAEEFIRGFQVGSLVWLALILLRLLL